MILLFLSISLDIGISLRKERNKALLRSIKLEGHELKNHAGIDGNLKKSKGNRNHQTPTGNSLFCKNHP